MTRSRWRELGQQRIDQPDQTCESFPFNWLADTPFRQTFEYTVEDFPAEVGFMSAVFGLELVALDSTYALFTTAGKDFWFSIRRASAEYPVSNPAGLCLMFMTRDYERGIRWLTDVDPDFPLQQRIEPGGQHVCRFYSPCGLAIEIWEDPA